MISQHQKQQTRSCVAVGLGFGLAFFVLASYLAPRGFEKGFVDIAHDSYVLKTATDLNAGSTLFKNTFTQYGYLGDHFNAVILKFENRLLFLKIVYAFVYAVSVSIFVYFVAKHSGYRWAMVLGTLVTLSAPLYRHGIMLSVHVPILLLELILIIFLFSNQSHRKTITPVFTGFVLGLVFLFKQNFGAFLLLATILGLVLSRFSQRRVGAPHNFVRKRFLVLMSFTFVLVLLVPLVVMIRNGSLFDWYQQTIVFPQDHYVDYFSAGRVRPEILNILEKFPILPWHLMPGVVLKSADTFVSHPLWMILRLVILVLIGRKIRGETNNTFYVVLLSFFIAGTLTLYPSSNFMHQWWTLVPVLLFLPQLLSENSKTPGKKQPRLSLNFSRLLPVNVRNKYCPSVEQILAVSMVLLMIFGDRFSVSTNNFIAVRERLNSCETIAEPKVLSGMCTTPEFATDLRIVSKVLSRELEIVRKTYPDARAVSLDFEPLVSLLAVASIQDNDSRCPVIWQLRDLAEIYSVCDSEVFSGKNVFVTYGELEDDHLDGYDVRLQKAVSPNYGWTIFSPSD